MAPIDVEEVLSQLTVREKIALLSGRDFWHTVPIPRLSVPSIRTSDGPNGIRGTRFFDSVPSACFPCGTALGATWDAPLLREAGKLMAAEARAKGAHVILGPTINIQRSPLGGRVFESFSEDPVLSGELAAAEISGIQKDGIQATIKHFVCNDMEHERMAVDVRVSERAFREGYMAAFQIAMRDAKPMCFMTSYSKVNGLHVSENKRILHNILRDEWGFEGLVMSDWFGTYSTSESVNAGLDLEMPGPAIWRGDLLAHAYASKKVPEFVLDERVRAVLRMVKRAQEGTDIQEDAHEGTNNNKNTSALLRRIAAESIVLLKNEKNVLPLDRKKKVAVIGPNGSVATYCGGGSAWIRPYYTVSPLDAVKEKCANVQYTVGVNSYKLLPNVGQKLKTPTGEKGMALRLYDKAASDKSRQLLETLTLDDSNALLGDYKSKKLTGILFYAELEGVLTAEESGEFELGLCVYGIGKVYVDDQLVVDNETKQMPGDSFFGGGTREEKGTFKVEKGKEYRIVLYWGSGPLCKLEGQGTTPNNAGGFRLGGIMKTTPQEEHDKAVKLAREVDQVILTIGLDGEYESEGYDREYMDLPPGTDELISAVVAANPNTVVCMQSGTPVAMPWIDRVPGVIQAWYGGNETGNGIADVLFGDVNPSGKLPLSFPIRLEDNPAYLNYRSEKGRVLYGEEVYIGYKHYEKVGREVLFPFGHGLSYTTFSISDINVSTDPSSDTLTVRARVTNTGRSDGAQVVQIYVSYDSPAASVGRPNKELRGFQKVHLKAGEAAALNKKISLKYATSFWDEERDMWCVEKGVYGVWVGDSSKSARREGEFEIPKSRWWKGL